MCDHSFRFLEGMRVCTKCGVNTWDLDTRVTSFNEGHKHTKRPYCRQKRFLRIFSNLQGNQNVPNDVMERISVRKFADPQELSQFIKNDHSLRKYRGKIASIWYLLGNRWPPITQAELMKARAVFNSMTEKVSFLVLIPYTCIMVGREDLLCFCKSVSPNLWRKYSQFLFTS